MGATGTLTGLTNMFIFRWIVIGICLFLAINEYALSIPLSNWTTWSTAQPYVSKQVPPGALIARCKDLDTYCVLEVDQTTGALPVDLQGGSIAIDFSGPTGDPVPADAGFVGGVDGSGDLRGLSVDTDGQLQVDVLSSALPNGAATAAKQPALGTAGTASADVITVQGITSMTPLSVTVGGTVPLPTGAATEATLLNVLTETSDTASNTADIVTNTATIAGAVDGTEMQVDIVAPIPAGSNTIGAISNLPASVNTGAGAWSNGGTLRVTEGSRFYSDSALQNYTSGNVTTGAWTQVIASLAAATNVLCVTDTSGQIMELGTGSAASETRVFLIAQGFSGCIPLSLGGGTRISVRAVTATANTGYLVLSGLN